jgi:hypothetical protein
MLYGHQDHVIYYHLFYFQASQWLNKDRRFETG